MLPRHDPSLGRPRREPHRCDSLHRCAVCGRPITLDPHWRGCRGGRRDSGWEHEQPFAGHQARHWLGGCPIEAVA